jgi:hypothetical protein
MAARSDLGITVFKIFTITTIITIISCQIYVQDMGNDDQVLVKIDRHCLTMSLCDKFIKTLIMTLMQ